MSELEELKRKLDRFIKERDWDQFHIPKDLAIAISIEAGELLEHFQWKEDYENKEEMAEEVADIMLYLLSFCRATDIDLYKETVKKLEKNKVRYPKDLVKGKAHKYDHYQNDSE